MPREGTVIGTADSAERTVIEKTTLQESGFLLYYMIGLFNDQSTELTLGSVARLGAVIGEGASFVSLELDDNLLIEG